MFRLKLSGLWAEFGGTAFECEPRIVHQDFQPPVPDIVIITHRKIILFVQDVELDRFRLNVLFSKRSSGSFAGLWISLSQ